VPRQVAECGVACCWPAPTISRLRSGRGVSPVSHVIRPPGPDAPRYIFVIASTRDFNRGPARWAG
jgi:hypothetical protein